MGRWEPDARGRLEQADLDLYQGLSKRGCWRGVPDPGASVAVEVGVIAFKSAFDRWASKPDEQDLPRLLREFLDQLKGVVTRN